MCGQARCDVEKYIPDFINIVSSERLPREIQHAVATVLIAIQIEMNVDRWSTPNIPINLVFYQEDLLSIFNFTNDAIAACSKIAYCLIDRLKSVITHDYLVIAAIAEELCHLIWDISDEIIVKYKVLSAVRNIRKETTIEDLYSLCDPKALKRSFQEFPKEMFSALPYRIPLVSDSLYDRV